MANIPLASPPQNSHHAAVPSAVAPCAATVAATKQYGTGDTTVTALGGVSVQFRAQAFTAIMGPSGSGKSTLLHCLAGLDTVDSGEVYIGNTELGSLSDTALTLLRRKEIGFVFQAFNLIPTLSARDNIVLPLTLGGSKVDRDWLDLVISTVGLQDRLSHRPTELSGGQQQRVAVARALASRPSVILADEPTGNLDSHSGAEVLSFLRRAVDDHQQSIVMVTHDPVAASYADDVIFLADGQIVDALSEPTTDSVLQKMTALTSARVSS